MMRLSYFVLLFISAFVCYKTAKKHNLSQPWLWTLGGATLHVFAVAVVLFAARYVSEKKRTGGVT